MSAKTKLIHRLKDRNMFTTDARISNSVKR